MRHGGIAWAQMALPVNWSESRHPFIRHFMEELQGIIQILVQTIAWLEKNCYNNKHQAQYY